jgi:hypothetical protein
MSEGAEWQRGYDLAYLRKIADLFRATDENFVLGAFTGYKERDVASALAAGELLMDDYSDPTAAIYWSRVKNSQAIKDFTGEERARMWPGDINVKRIGFLPGRAGEADVLLTAIAREAAKVRGNLWVQIWQEHPTLRRMIETKPFRLAAVKIPASSEIVGVYVAGKSATVKELHPFEEYGLHRLRLAQPQQKVEGYIDSKVMPALKDLPAWADHYSSYNQGHSWSALSLRGFSDDPNFIVKPSEMSKKWKQDHEETLSEPVRDTPLREKLAVLEPLIGLVPGEHQRIRLMRLQPGGGELTRHADITDPEAGAMPGKVMRIHLPLVTNKDVIFTSWKLDGSRISQHFERGTGWYLDTRKPHTAVNMGETARVHLVIDAFASRDLAAMFT